MPYMVAPAYRGLPTHRTRDAALAAAWAERYATFFRATFTIWELRGGRPRKLLEVTPARRGTPA
jgi:hypothetical protein